VKPGREGHPLDVFNCASACKSKVPKELGITSPYSGNQSIPSHCCLIALGLPDDSSTLGFSIIFFNEQQEQLEILAKCGSCE
jgi:hypothetical protein